MIVINFRKKVQCIEPFDLGGPGGFGGPGGDRGGSGGGFGYVTLIFYLKSVK